MGDLGVVIVAAGIGSRMRSKESKQYLLLDGKPILIYSLEMFQQLPDVESIVLVVGAQDIERCEEYVKEYRLSKVKAVVSGGSERQDSVFRGLVQLDTEYVMVHDAVRPLVTEEQINRCLHAMRNAGSAVLAVPVKDTIKVVDDERKILSTPDRRSLWAIQTPQAFRLSALLRAHEQARREHFVGTDDASLMERIGSDVIVVEGSYENIKITTPEDLSQAELILSQRGGNKGDQRMIRIGQGFDVHQLVEGRECIIGGVSIPYEKGLLGHSDADVLLHAISDAILGAIAQGDIGKHFPDTDDDYKGADSMALLGRVWDLAKGMGYRLGNVDATIIAQQPKMAPHIPLMVERIADALEAAQSQVNVKATTSERLGFTGRGEGIAAQAVVCLIHNL